MKAWKKFLLAIVVVATVASIWATIVLRRGFRATAVPSPWEAALARGVRDLAIPTSARRQKNPLQPTPQNLEEGRNNFLARCAICHGQDGSGLTPMGANLYPACPTCAPSRPGSHRRRNSLHHRERSPAYRHARLGQSPSDRGRRQLETGSLHPRPASPDPAGED